MIGKARVGVRTLQRLLPRSRQGTRVLAYHLVEGGTSLPVDLSLASFRRQLEGLSSITQVKPIDTLLNGEEPTGAEGPTLVLTFDDAFRNFAEVVWPQLRDLSLPSTLFVPVGFVAGEETSPLRNTRLPAISWSELRGLVETGLVGVGSHGWTHRDLRCLSNAELHKELTSAKNALEDRLGVAVDTFAYPKALWDRRVEAVVGATYRLAVIGGGRRITASNFHPTRVWRTSVTRALGDDLKPLVQARIWLDEWLADIWRRRFRRRARSG